MLKKVTKMMQDANNISELKNIRSVLTGEDDLWEDLKIMDSMDSDEFILNNSKPTPSVPEVPTTPPPIGGTEPPAQGNKIRSKDELEKLLAELGGDIDDSIPHMSNDKNKNTFTRSELYLNIEKMSSSSNPEVAGIGKVLSDLFKALSVDLWEDDPNDPMSFAKIFIDSDNKYSNILMDTVIAAIQGKELDPESNGEKTMISIGDQTGLSIDDLMALDKNGDGSIVEELKELLTNKDFIKTCEFKIQREKNHESNNNLINSIDKKDKNNESDEKITEDEMLAAFGQNEIADLFKMSDGSVDKALMLVLGGVKQKDGTYTISVNILKNRIYLMDKDRDGKITKEEVEIFKNSDYYKEMLNIHG